MKCPVQDHSQGRQLIAPRYYRDVASPSYRIEVPCYIEDGQVSLQRAFTITLKEILTGYLTAMKPGIVGLVLIATLAGVYFAQKGFPPIKHLFFVLLGTGMASAGSGILNNYIDRDIDSIMERTSSRSLVAGRVSPAYALIMGFLMVVVSIGILEAFVNALVAFLTATSVIIYLCLYSIFLKRRTHYANYIGGIAGALPPVIGYTSIAGRVDMVPVILFTIVLVWQQIHAMSLALRYRDDYAKAGIPVWPVVKGGKATRQGIVYFSAILLVLSIIPYLYGMAGSLYLLSSVFLGTVYLFLAVKEVFSSNKNDMRLFFFSILYLTILFTVMIIDAGR